MGLVSRLWRLMVSLWVILVLLMVGIVEWRMSTTTGETICLQFANTDRMDQMVYPSIIDTRRGIVASLPDHVVPDAVITISENSAYRVRQYYHFKRVFPSRIKLSLKRLGQIPQSSYRQQYPINRWYGHPMAVNLLITTQQLHGN